MTVAWTTPAAVARALGPSVDVASNADYLADVVAAANDWAVRKRIEAGYADIIDDDTPAPSGDVALGTTLYAVALFRERGAVDSFPSFDEVASFAPTGTMGQIRRLLGIGRARIDTAPAAPAVVTARYGRRRGLA